MSWSLKSVYAGTSSHCESFPTGIKRGCGNDGSFKSRLSVLVSPTRKLQGKYYLSGSAAPAWSQPVEPCGMITILLFAEDRPRLQYAGGFDLAGHVSRNDVPDAVDKVHI